MKRPKKKEISCEDTSYAQLEEIGYNQACDDWEKWTEKCQEDFISVSSLPSCKEIEEIIKNSDLSYFTDVIDKEIKELTKALHKRLRGE